jgi:protein-L-isoaspartate(D-aspartate) O-methyltransferase
MTAKTCCRWALLGCLLAPGMGSVGAGAEGRSLEEARGRMVDQYIVGAGVKNQRVIDAMRATPRHEFVPLAQRKYAYLDMALPIGEGQTISPPFVVAYMTEALDPQPTDKVLEIGTGSGYQAAVLSPLVREVYTIEIVVSLGRTAGHALKRLHYDNVHAKVGDGYQGWPEHAPFDKIIVTCSPESVPPALVEQLKEGGRMIVPVGERYQQTLYMMKKAEGKLVSESLQPTLFVPMTGKAEAGRQVKPDPAHPAIVNGDFEETLGDPPQPCGWHYQRRLEVFSGPEAPQGKNYVVFRIAEPSQSAQALQGFAVDGRKAQRLEISLQVRAKDIRPGPNAQQFPMLGIAFYDEKRAEVGQWSMAAWHGTFAWRSETALIDVPLSAREAILRIGLQGAAGEIAFDAIHLKTVKK